MALRATRGTILAAGYALYLYRRIIFGKLEKPSLKGILDLSLREIAILAPLVVLTIYYGVHPAPIIDASKAAVDKVSAVTLAAQATAATKTASTLVP